VDGQWKYFGRTVRGLEALTWDGRWYLHRGQDADGVWLYRLPQWWQFKWKRREIR
jgi:hypothetical protein